MKIRRQKGVTELLIFSVVDARRSEPVQFLHPSSLIIELVWGVNCCYDTYEMLMIQAR